VPTHMQDYSTMNLRNRRCSCIPIPAPSPQGRGLLIIGGLCLLPIFHPGSRRPTKSSPWACSWLTRQHQKVLRRSVRIPHESYGKAVSWVNAPSPKVGTPIARSEGGACLVPVRSRAGRLFASGLSCLRQAGFSTCLSNRRNRGVGSRCVDGH
jgi:hypothetical protein